MGERPQRGRTSQPRPGPWEGAWAAREGPAWAVKVEASLMSWQREAPAGLSNRPPGMVLGAHRLRASHRHGAQRFEKKITKKKKTNPTEGREGKCIWENTLQSEPRWRKTVRLPGPCVRAEREFCAGCRLLHQPSGENPGGG